jgi:hypothetical protein
MLGLARYERCRVFFLGGRVDRFLDRSHSLCNGRRSMCVFFEKTQSGSALKRRCFQARYQWLNTSANLIIDDPARTVLNPYIGGPSTLSFPLSSTHALPIIRRYPTNDVRALTHEPRVLRARDAVLRRVRVRVPARVRQRVHHVDQRWAGHVYRHGGWDGTG